VRYGDGRRELTVECHCLIINVGLEGRWWVGLDLPVDRECTIELRAQLLSMSKLVYHRTESKQKVIEKDRLFECLFHLDTSADHVY
jgi:hypothetical protein